MVFRMDTVPWSNRGIGPPPTWLNAWVCFALQRRRAESEGARERSAKQQGEGEGAVFATNGESGAGRPLKRRGRDGGGGAVVPHGWVGDRVTSSCRGHLVTLRRAWHWHARFPAMSFNTMATITDGLTDV